MSNITKKIFYLFIKPELGSADYQDQAKFDFGWFICVFYVVCTSCLLLVSLLNNDSFVFYFTVALVFSFACLAMVKLNPKSYKSIINVLCFSITVLQFVALLAVKDQPHLLEGYWMVVVALTAFFILDNRWGFFYLLLNGILNILYFNLFLIDPKRVDYFWHTHSVIQNSIEFSIAMVLIGFIMFKYAKFNTQIIRMHKEALNNLSMEKEIVDKKSKESIVLLQEIHHRVKNNLQVIVSLLRMQSGGLESIEAKESFQKAINRIMIMSLVHQNMYEKSSLVDIDLEDYMRKLLENIISANITDIDIDYSLEVELKNLIPEKIVPLGLILNELITNSMKYAFTSNGKIEIEIKRKDAVNFTMRYFDNGTWKEKPDNSSLGLQLIDVFTEQLDGEFKRVINEEGTVYHFNFMN